MVPGAVGVLGPVRRPAGASVCCSPMSPWLDALGCVIWAPSSETERDADDALPEPAGDRLGAPLRARHRPGGRRLPRREVVDEVVVGPADVGAERPGDVEHPAGEADLGAAGGDHADGPEGAPQLAPAAAPPDVDARQADVGLGDADAAQAADEPPRPRRHARAGALARRRDPVEHVRHLDAVRPRLHDAPALDREGRRALLRRGGARQREQDEHEHTGEPEHPRILRAGRPLARHCSA